MNTTGCADLLATDEAFQPGVQGTCDTSIVGFYLYTMLTAGLALITAVKQYANWKRRSQHTSKLPRGPIIQFLFSLLQFLGSALTGVNLINFHNGLTFSLFSVMFLNFAFAYSLGLIRLVSLGEKIIPKSRRPTGEASAKLGSFDTMGKFLLIFQIFSLASSSIVLIILSPILTGNEDVISRIGWGFKAMFLMMCQFGYWYQFERCIRAIKSIQGDAAGIRAGDTEKHIRSTELGMAIWKMRKNQLVHFSASPAVIIFALLTIGAVPANVYVVYITGLSQAIGGLAFEFNVKAGTGSRPVAKSSSKQNRVLNNGMMVQSVMTPPGTTASVVRDSEGGDSRA